MSRRQTLPASGRKKRCSSPASARVSLATPWRRSKRVAAAALSGGFERERNKAGIAFALDPHQHVFVPVLLGGGNFLLQIFEAPHGFMTESNHEVPGAQALRRRRTVLRDLGYHDTFRCLG